MPVALTGPVHAQAQSITGAGAPAGAPTAASPHAPSFGALLEARASRAMHVPHTVQPPPAPPQTPARLEGAGLGALHRIEAAQARLDGMLAAARGGRTFSAQELMALQAESHAFARTVELSAKLAELGAQSVKQALQAQV